MALLKEKDRRELEKIFKEKLTGKVKIVYFTQTLECQFCQTTRELLAEVSAASPNLALEIYNFQTDKEQVEKFRIDKIPATVLLGEGGKDYGIRFYGIPAGYELMTLIEDIIDVGRGDPGLPANVMELLAKVDRPVHMQAFVSPTCPYCTTAVRAAHRFAMASAQITGDMVEVSEFPHLAVKYQVQGVPKTVINEKYELIGGLPEIDFAKKVLEAVGH